MNPQRKCPTSGARNPSDRHLHILASLAACPRIHLNLHTKHTKNILRSTRHHNALGNSSGTSTGTIQTSTAGRQVQNTSKRTANLHTKIITLRHQADLIYQGTKPRP